MKRKGREEVSLKMFLDEAEDLESRSQTDSRAQVGGLLWGRGRSPSFAEHGAGEVPDSLLMNCQLCEGRIA